MYAGHKSGHARDIKREEKKEMTQVSWFLTAEATTTNIYIDATTSGPFKIPADAPDIAAFIQSTTVTGALADVVIGTTMYYEAPVKTWGKSVSTNGRCFSIASNKKMYNAGSPINIRYRAVGELIRS